ncbi:MAG: Glu-tRNA(Gln) amidotransferase subunit GatE [Candidatus Heimdallarchaeota archaeon]|nr:Glu-tRNA(Gln) amidotransferase subunit GatE [Candidatus Heimdallarchaeota archaeon]
MIDLDKIDFKKMGFLAGLEVHHQIDTKRKLFCNCVPKLSDGEPDYLFERYFRPVLGEMGDFDAGMLIEFEKGYRVIYHAYEESVCVYEQDEQPPFWPDKEAIYKGYELAHWLNFSAMVDEIVVSRKQYLDGSITTGFQRTMIIARDGYIPINNKKVRISNLTVEEDAARKIKTENYGRTVYYNLDRLGIPLVEVITDHRDCTDPEELRQIAEYIGLALRLSKIGKRGIGTVRQDVNLSITGGDRVEIKGVQDLDMFDQMCRREVARQDMLIKIAKVLKERSLTKDELEHTYIDLTENFNISKVPKNFIIMGIRLPKFGDILKLEIQPRKDFGQDIIEKTELISGIPRQFLFQSDEMDSKSFRRNAEKEHQNNFFFEQMTPPIDKKIRKILNLKKDDAYFLALGPQKWVIHALKKIIERSKMALDGVPQETRRLTLDGNSEFLRVIHGKDRLYPDTDTPPIDMDMEKIQKLKEKVGIRPWEIFNELNKKYGYDYYQVVKLIRHDLVDNIIKLIEEHQINPQRGFDFYEKTLIALRREGLDTSVINFEQIIEILKSANEGMYDYNQIPNITRTLLKQPTKKIKQVLSDLKIKSISEIELIRFYEEAHNEVKSKYDISKLDKKELANKITGDIMRRIRGSFSGKKVYDFVQTKLGGKQ